MSKFAGEVIIELTIKDIEIEVAPSEDIEKAILEYGLEIANGFGINTFKTGEYVTNIRQITNDS